MKTIFINATAAQYGGALTILNQFLDSVAQSCPPEIHFIVFCTIPLESRSCSSITFVQSKRKNFLNRLLWDYTGMKEWSKKNKILPQLILSFQNTGVFFSKIPQVIYLHQPIPFTDVQWNFFNSEERSLWFYKHIYPLFIRITIFKQTRFIVQTKWMKNAVCNYFNLSENRIMVARPNHNIIKEQPTFRTLLDNDLFNFIYPASAQIYKNHLEIIRAVRNLKKNINTPLFKIHFTCTFDELSQQCKSIIKNHELSDSFIFHGALPIENVYQLYREADCLLFPSKIETVGLPLIEAAGTGMFILSSDSHFARELLDKYSNVKFIPIDNEEEWTKQILLTLQAKPKRTLPLENNNNDWGNILQLIY